MGAWQVMVLGVTLMNSMILLIFLVMLAVTLTDTGAVSDREMLQKLKRPKLFSSQGKPKRRAVVIDDEKAYQMEREEKANRTPSL